MSMDTAPAERPTRVRWLIFGLACAVSWLLYLHRYAWSVIRVPLKEENPDLTDPELGWLDSLFMAPYALGQVPGGIAGDLLGGRVVLPLMILAWSGCVAAFALVSVSGLATVRMLFGFSQAGAYPVLSKVTRNWFPLSVRTTVQGMVASFFGRAGGACASVLVATVLMSNMGLTWRQAFMVLAAAGVALAVVFWLLFRNNAREHPWANESEAQLIEVDSAPSVPGVRPRLDLRGRRGWTLGAMLLYAFASTFADQLFVIWIPQFLHEAKGLRDAQMGLYASLPLFGGALGGAVGGVLNDVMIRLTGNRRFGRSSVGLTGKLVGAVFLAASVSIGDGRLVMVMLFGCKFFGDWTMSTQWGTLTDISGRASATVFGVVNMVGASAAFFANPIMGWVKRYHGWDALFFTVAGIWVVAALCWIVIDCTQKLVEEAPVIKSV
jgi:sugar phosphate permease